MDYLKKEEWLELRFDRKKLAGEGGPITWAEQVLSVPPGFLQKLHNEQGIQVTGDRIRLRLFPHEAAKFEAQWLDLEPLYEDDFCLVADKPAGMKVHPTEEGETGTLANAVAGYYLHTGQLSAVRHIHRLDKDTSGPVLYAKNEFAQLKLDAAMRIKAIERIYLAVASGRLKDKAGMISQPIGRDRHMQGKMRVFPGGKAAVTRYRLLQQYRDATLLEVFLETGRTHQIRVHMSHIGHPLLGDVTYGLPSEKISRQALHGSALIFNQPWSGEQIRIEAPLPEDMRRLVESLH